MQRWKQTVKITDLHQDYQAGNLDTQLLAKSVFDRLKRLSYYCNDSDFEEIVDWFKDVADTEGADIDDYDNVLRELYDWGDYDKRLWIETIVT